MMKGMDKRGQVSVEYLLVVLVLILVLSIITIPLIGTSIDASKGVSLTSDAKVAVDTLANAADLVYANGPGAKRTVSFYIPQTSTLNITSNNSNNYIILPVTYLNSTFKGNSSNVTVNVNTSTQYTLGNATNATITIPVNSGWHTAEVFWNVSNKFISITIT